MKTLVISDIHVKHKQAQAIIDKFPADEVVLLGDYFDDWDDNPEMNADMAKWLKVYLKKPNHKALIGNHDVSYIYGGVEHCSGYHPTKNKFINNVMDNEDWNKLKLAYKTQGWWLTHAGISGYAFLPPMGIGEFNEAKFIVAYKKAEAELKAQMISDGRLLGVGYTRGGNQKIGGITWCHYPEEFTHMDGVKQIFGHTMDREIRLDGDNCCLDTRLRHAAIIEDGELKVHTL